MKAVIALLLASIALSNAADFSYDMAYQYYTVTYDLPACPLASVAVIEYGSYSYASTGGTSINSYCSYGIACTADGNGSYETVCVHGEVANLGAKVISLWGTCSASTVRPLIDTYDNYGYGTNTLSTDREIYDLKTWRDGCHIDSYYTTDYNFITIGATGCSVNTNGYCGTNSSCTAADCTSADDYTVATATGCATQYTDVYMECNSATWSQGTATTIGDLFTMDDTMSFWYQGYCAAFCAGYELGDGYCDTSCQVASCDFDCDALGNCDCCVPASSSLCCTPPVYATSYTTNVCCDVDPTDMELVANNTAWVQVFEACICDGINSNLNPDNSVSVTAGGLCDLTNMGTTTTTTTTSTSTTMACDSVKILSWCHAHALQDKSYTEVLGTSSTTTEWVKAVVTSWTTTLDSGSMGVPLPECLSLSGQFVNEYTYTGSSYYSGSVQNFCELYTTAYPTCDADCGSASTLVLSALLALVF